MSTSFRKLLCGGLLALVSGSISLLGCLPEDDFQDIEIMAPSPKLSLPLLNTHLVLSDLITVDKENSLLVENEDKSYSLLYKTHIASKPVGEYFPEIPEQNYLKNFSLALNAPTFYLNPAPVTFKEQIPLDLKELTLYKIESKQGLINIALTSNYQHDIKAEVTIPDIQDKDGKPLLLTFNLHYWGGNASTQSISLENYRINVNDSKINYEVKIYISGSGRPIHSSDEVSFQFYMSDIQFSYIEGNFTNIHIPVSADTLNIPLLANAINGNIALNPKLNMQLASSYGVKVLPDLSHLYIEHRGGSVVRLQDEGESKFLSGSFDFPYLMSRNDTFAVKQQIVDDTNSNIEEAFTELPKGMAYHFGFMLSSTENDTSFISDQSAIEVDMQVELPMEGSFNVILEDTMAVDFKDIAENLEELKVLIKTENSFPIDAKLQVFFLDEQNDKIKDETGEPITLFEEGAKFLEAATITNTHTGDTEPLNVDMPLAATIDNKKYALLERTKNFLIRAEMSSVSEQNNRIKLYSFYNIRFSMAMQIRTSL